MRRGDGLCMAVENVRGKRKVGNVGAADGADPKKGLPRAVIPIEELAQKVFEEQVAEIIHCILYNVVELKHLGSAKFLIEFVTLVRSGKDLPATVFEAFAETLKQKFMEPGKDGPGEGLDEEQSQGGNTPVTDAEAPVGIG